MTAERLPLKNKDRVWVVLRNTSLKIRESEARDILLYGVRGWGKRRAENAALAERKKLSRQLMDYWREIEILQKQVRQQNSEKEREQRENITIENEVVNDPRYLPIAELPISTRAKNVLIRAGCRIVIDAIQMNEAELKNAPEIVVRELLGKLKIASMI